MNRNLVTAALTLTLAGGLGLASIGNVAALTPSKPLPRVVVFVESQGLCYDSIVTAQGLPANGPFQALEADPGNHCGAAAALKTDFGPGDKGYVGGRWVMTMPDTSVVRFMCPLIGPGTAPVNP